MVPISTTKHNMILLNIGLRVIWGSICCDPGGGAPQIHKYFRGSKTISFSERFRKKTKLYDGGILMNL